MPLDPNDYKKNRAYYLAREASDEGKKKRAERQRGRRMEIAKGVISQHDPREVDHIKPLAKGGSGAPSNLEVISRTANRKKFDH